MEEIIKSLYKDNGFIKITISMNDTAIHVQIHNGKISDGRMFHLLEIGDSDKIGTIDDIDIKEFLSNADDAFKARILKDKE